MRRVAHVDDDFGIARAKSDRVSRAPTKQARAERPRSEKWSRRAKGGNFHAGAPQVAQGFTISPRKNKSWTRLEPMEWNWLDKGGARMQER